MTGASIATGGLAGASGVSLATGGLIDAAFVDEGAPGVGDPGPTALDVGAVILGWQGAVETPYAIAGRLAFDLTPENLERYGLDPIIPGEYSALHFQAIAPGGAPVSLFGAELVFTLRRRDLSIDDATLVLVRSSATEIGGWAPATRQLVVAPNQDAAGAGLWSLVFAPVDQDVLTAVIGRWFFDVRARWVDGKVMTLLRGRAVIPAPRTLFT